MKIEITYTDSSDITNVKEGEKITFDNAKDLDSWDNSMEVFITAYTLTYDDGTTAGNEGINAGAYLYTLLDDIGCFPDY